MLYIAKPPNFPYTSSTVNMLIMNQFHSFTKETKPSKKRKSNPVKLRSRGGGEGEIGAEARSSGGETEAARSSGAVLRSTSGAVRLSDWSSVYGHRRSLFFLSLCDLGSLFLLFTWVFYFCGSLSFLRVLRKMFEGKTIM